MPRSLLSRLHSGSTYLLDLIYPRDCLIEGDPLSETDYQVLSSRAAARLPVIRDPRCPTCGHPYFGELERVATCFHCAELNPVYKEARCGYLFMRDVRTLLHACKYHNRPHIAKDLAKLLRAAPGMPEFLENRIVVPIPLHPRKFRERGFNQTDVILQAYDKISPQPLQIENVLCRVLDTDSQTRRNRKERLRSVRNAFALREDALIKNQREYVLFDDVFTTGSTLNTCARLLKQAGVPEEQIHVAAFAHG